MRSSLLLVTVTAALISGISNQILTLPKGGIKGSVESYTSEGKYTAFRGIPYAKPPTGSLRLQHPEEPEPWSSVLDATEFGSKCPQWDWQKQNVVGDENCLFINVYTPRSLVDDVSSSTVFPVMVFIHGGNYQRGSSDAYDPEWFVQRGIVFVTFNYRLGILGFLSTGDSSCPGNLGLKDQVLALKWVQDNIKLFGGNSDSITLFGQGAGAASVFLHILSPQSQGLFHQAITQSGSPLCDWTVEEIPRSYAVEVAQRLSCSTKSNSALVDCIRKKPLNDLLVVQKNEKNFGDYPLRAIPVVEKDGFLPDTPAKLLSSPNYRPVPLMSGINKDDGAILYPVIHSYEEILRKNASFLVNNLIPMFVLTATDIRGNIESVSQALLFHYFDGVDSKNISQVLQSFVNMTTDAMFVSCNYRTLQNYSAKGARTYMYTFEYRGEHSMLQLQDGRNLNYSGVSHGDELLYMFNFKNAPIEDDDNMKKEQLLFMWTSFAKTGDVHTLVNYEYPKWWPYNAELKNYYSINKDIRSRTFYRQREIDLWLNHLPALSKVRPSDDHNRIEYQVGGFGWAMLAIALVLLIVVAVLAVILLRRSKNRYFSTRTEDK